jgi:hypothetical protein
MNSFTTDITEQYLTNIYENLQREQITLMNSLKSTDLEDAVSKERDITRQITLINTINLNVMRLRNTRKKTNCN